MDAILMQDWVSLASDSTLGRTVTLQAASQWLDVGDAADVAFFLDVAEVSGTPTLAYQTSPLRESGSFVSLLSFIPTSTANRIDRVSLYNNPSPALARLLRWSVTSADVGAVWTLTFRLNVLAYRR